MAKKQIKGKKSSIPFVIREMQIKHHTEIILHTYWVGYNLKKKSKKRTSIHEDVKKLEPLYITGRNIK